jgi:hypothetical protein
MKLNTLKQSALLIISAIGLYYSGHSVLTTSSIQSLLDMLNLIAFFACFFSFLIFFISLTTKFFKSFAKLVAS